MSKMFDLRGRLEKRAQTSRQAITSDLIAALSQGASGALLGSSALHRDRARELSYEAVGVSDEKGLQPSHMGTLRDALKELNADRDARMAQMPRSSSRSIVPYSAAQADVADPSDRQRRALEGMLKGMRSHADAAPEQVNRLYEQQAQEQMSARAAEGYLSAVAPLAAMTSFAPVNKRLLSAALVTNLGGVGAGLLTSHFAPRAGPVLTGLASAGGALAGRAALRGYDLRLKEKAKKERAAAKAGGGSEKTSTLQRLAVRLSRR